MAYTIKNRTLPGSPFLADYDCEACGRFELLVQRDQNGDPPNELECPLPACVDEACKEAHPCGQPAKRVFSAAKIANPAFIPTAINPPGSTRHDKPDPRALDTRDLAEGKVTKAQWRKKQLEITKARRHAKRIKAGRATKRIQVDSAGIR